MWASFPLTPLVYRYFAVHWGCKLALPLILIAANAPGHEHAAVWVGAQTPHATAWVQAGIYDQAGQAYVYVESQVGNNLQLNTRLWMLKRPARVRLEHRDGRWRAGVDGFWSRWLRLPNTRRASAFELYGDAHATVSIGGKITAR